MAARSFEVVVPELAATLVEDEDGDVVLVDDDDGDVLVRLDELVSSLATVLEGVAVVPLVSLAFELSVELDFEDVSLAATDVEVSDFELSEVVEVVVELGEVVLATEELLLGEVADVLLLGEVVLLPWFELYVPPADVAELLEGAVLFELKELLLEAVEEDGLLVLAVLFVELYGLEDVAAEFVLVELGLLVAAVVLAVFDVSDEAVVDGLV